MKKIIYILCGILFFASVSSCTPTKEVDGEIEQVFYLNEDNNILQVKLKGSIYEVINLSKSSGAPLPASNLSVSFYNDMTYVFYVDINNDVIELVEQTSKFTVHSLSSFLDNTELNGKISSLIRDDEKSIIFAILIIELFLDNEEECQNQYLQTHNLLIINSLTIK